MDKYISVPLEERSIVALYDGCARTLGYDPESCYYDCRKVEVSQEHFESIRQFYREMPNTEFGMIWANYGPKIHESLVGPVVHLLDGFIKEEE